MKPALCGPDCIIWPSLQNTTTTKRWACRAGASEDEIRKAYRKLARKYHPDLNPGDKSAEDRFKNVQEAYDILSDSKKRQMYDQVGFYSENGFPARARPRRAAARIPNMDFNGFDFSEMFRTRRPEPEPAATPPAETRRRFQRYLQPVLPRRRAERKPKQAPEKGADLEYGSTSVSGRRSAAPRPKSKSPVTSSARPATAPVAATPATSPVRNATGTGNVTQMAGNMKFNLTCPRCNGKGR